MVVLGVLGSGLETCEGRREEGDGLDCSIAMRTRLLGFCFRFECFELRVVWPTSRLLLWVQFRGLDVRV